MTLKLLLVSVSVAGSASEITPCKDITADDTEVSTCWANFEWAKSTGFTTHPEWYESYDVTADSDTAVWQCALYQKANEEGTTQGHEDNYPSRDHNCPYPCTTSTHCLERTQTEAPTKAPTAAPETTDSVVKEEVVTVPEVPLTTTEEPASSSVPTWMIGVCIVGALLVTAIPAFFCLGGDKKQKSPKKKKRAVKASREAEKEESVPLAAAAEPEPEMSQPLQPAQMYTAMPMTGPSESFVMGPAYHTTAMPMAGHPMTTAVPSVMPVTTPAPAAMPVTTAYPQHMPVPYVHVAQAPVQAVHGGTVAMSPTHVVAPTNVVAPMHVVAPESAMYHVQQ